MEIVDIAVAIRFSRVGTLFDHICRMKEMPDAILWSLSFSVPCSVVLAAIHTIRFYRSTAPASKQSSAGLLLSYLLVSLNVSLFLCWVCLEAIRQSG